jgi:hypothetical protein
LLWTYAAGDCGPAHSGPWLGAAVQTERGQ